NASSMLSARSCRPIRPRDAPNANLVLISRWRAEPRANISPATFRQARARSTAVATNKTQSARERLFRRTEWPWGAGVRANVDAMNRRSGNTDNRLRVLVHQYLSALDVLHASELVFPEVVREHNQRTRSRCLVIIDRQEAARCRAHAQYRKVRPGYEFRGSQP